MRELNDDLDDLKTRAGLARRVVGPGEMSALITESAELLPGMLLGTATFTVLAVLGTVTWLTAGSIVLASVLGLRSLWHVVFLIRAGLELRDRLATDAREQAHWARENGIDHEEGW
jgi:hypothetical protein